MASTAFVVVMIVVAVAISPALAVDYMVGDDKGWALNVNYTEWAAGKDFRVGDTIMFMYNNSNHNVHKVTGPAFQSCNKTSLIGDPLTSGRDTVPLTLPGKKWYICAVKEHCTSGMKLVITVNDALAPAPAPSAATRIVKSFAWMLAAAAAYWTMMA